MVIKEAKYLRENKKFNMAYFCVIFLDECGTEKDPQRLCIWGDTGEVEPEWCKPYREEILEHPLVRAKLIFASFKKKYKKKTTFPI